ncbi:MAG: epoxyqueuosine reductase QueH [Firmicutes bacterium]|nr:epoxyqueuosine reductase QueH [Bacillota bacterium]
MITMDKKKLLLHSCCGPCSTAVIERLVDSGEYDITVFYYNPNITDREEYELRKKEQMRFLGEFSVEHDLNLGFIEGDWDPQEFYDCAKGLENEPEGGARCRECFALRLERTAALAKEKGFCCFDTTLSVSPYKNYSVISAVGAQLSEKYGVEYLAGNYKKKDGYNRSIELSKAYGLYRQHYCGCEFSERDARKAMEKKAAEVRG